MALEEDRENRKRGRDDQGTGSEVIGGILKQYREQDGMTQRQLAERAGVHPTTIGKIESGERGMSLRVFSHIAWSFSKNSGDDFVWSVIEHLS